MSLSQPLDKLQRELVDKITNHSPLDEIRILFANGADPSEPVVQGLRPLHYAVYSNNMDCIRMLLVRGSDINALDDVGYSAMHLCAEQGNLEVLQYLIDHNGSVCFTGMEDSEFPQGYRSEEPLRLAIKNGHLDCAELMLQNGADPNAQYFMGSELSLISPTDMKSMRLLLLYGANPNAYNREGLTPLMRVCRHPDGESAAELLVEFGGSVNAWALDRQDFRTPLHYAILGGNESLVEFLLSHDANVNMPPDYGKPGPLDMAVLKDNLNILKRLLGNGANPNAVYTYIGTALHLACCSELKNQYDVMELLLEHGADLNICPVFDDAVMKSAFVEYFRTNREQYDPKIVRLMVQYGAQIVMQSPLTNPLGLLRILPRLKETADDRKIWRLLLDAAEGFNMDQIERLGLPFRRKRQLTQRASQPGSLDQIVRTSLRKWIRPFSPDVIQTLPITECMKQYLTFEYVMY